MGTANDITQLASALAQLAERVASNAPEPQAASRLGPFRVLLTVEEAAERLAVGRTTVYRLIRSGELDSVRVGRLRRVHVEAIDAYAAQLAAEARNRDTGGREKSDEEDTAT